MKLEYKLAKDKDKIFKSAYSKRMKKPRKSYRLDGNITQPKRFHLYNLMDLWYSKRVRM